MAKRWSGGLAFSPERELQVFREMALKGEHLTGTAMAGHGWEFTPGEKEDVIFDMTTESDADDDFFAMCKQAGWTHVLSVADTHIFKAAPGTVALHTDEQLETEILENQRNRFAKASVVSIVIFIAVFLLIANVEWPNIIEVVLGVAAIFLVVYTWMPLLGFQTKLVKARKQLDD